MKKNLARKISVLAMALVLIFTMLPALPVKAGVAGRTMPKSQTIVLQTVKEGKYTFVDQTSYLFKKNVTSVSSSNKKVAKVQKFNKKYVIVTPKKVGSSKITVKCGKKKYTMKFKVINYKNPFKSLKFGTVNATKEFAKYPGYTVSSISLNANTAKISVALNSGYSKLKIKVNGKAVANNANITFNDFDSVQFTVYNKATKRNEIYNLDVTLPLDWD